MGSQFEAFLGAMFLDFNKTDLIEDTGTHHPYSYHLLLYDSDDAYTNTLSHSPLAFWLHDLHITYNT